MPQLKIDEFVESHFGITLTPHQRELIALIAANPEKNFIVQNTGRSAGKTTAYKAAMAYLQDGLKPVDTLAVDRFEVIDGSGRPYVRGDIYRLPFDSIELSYQDGGKTLKVFIKEKTS